MLALGTGAGTESGTETGPDPTPVVGATETLVLTGTEPEVRLPLEAWNGVTGIPKLVDRIAPFTRLSEF